MAYARGVPPLVDYSGVAGRGGMRSEGLEKAVWVVVLAAVLAPAPSPPVPTSEVTRPSIEDNAITTTIFVDVTRQDEVPTGPRVREAVGHAWLFVELFLADLPGVVPRMDGVQDNPGLALALGSDERPWSVKATVLPDGDLVLVELLVCDPASVCVTHRAEGSRLAPNEVAGRLMQEVGAQMGRKPNFDPALWTAPITRDDYAILMAGRSAAILYGLIEPAAPELLGDNRRDPIARAVFLDPRMVSAWTVVARSSEDADRRLLAWKYATDGFPRSAALKAAHAAVLDERGLKELAYEGWNAVAALAPGDLRFLVPRARAALAVGNHEGASQTLALVPQEYASHPLIAMMNVAVADARGGADDGLLQRWQEADPTNAEPVRRRMALAVHGSDLEQALSLAPELSNRGADAEAQRATVALAGNLGLFDVAARAATALADEGLAQRLRAKATPDPLVRVTLLHGASDPISRLAHARALLDVGRTSDARVEVERLIKADPWWPEALALKSDVLAKAGQTQAAADVRSLLLHADPLYDEGRPK